MNGHRLVIKQQKSPIWRILSLVVALLIVLTSFYAGWYLAVEEKQQMISKVNWLQKTT